MKRQRHTEEQIIAVLQEAQAGATIEELCRRHGISQGNLLQMEAKVQWHGG
jgi:putative transposase